MASGDNTRMWFPEMLEILEKTWNPEMTWQELKEICISMSQKLENIRDEKGINTKLKGTCECGHQMVLSSKISIRSLLFSLKKIDAITEDEFKNLDKNWKSYQRKNKLNGYCESKEQSSHNQ